MKKKVFVGLSGGVDSSVSALLLKEQGYDVTGVFIRGWQPDWIPCTWKEDRISAMRTAAHLDIPFVTLNLEREYKDKVVSYLLKEYSLGRTPNPDMLCNREIKFGKFLNWAISMGADYVATGHYAQGANSEMYNSKDSEKDQTYFLSQVSKENLSKIIFPIGHLWKKDVRELAAKNNLPVATRKDSQGICFVGELEMKDFLKKEFQPKKGDVFNDKGFKVGEHDGAILYTIGERHGFKIFNQNTDSKKYFVTSKDLEKNIVYVSESYQDNFLQNTFEVTNFCNQSNKALESYKELKVMLRYRGEKNLVKSVEKKGETFVIKIINNQTISAGQYAVFYSGDLVVGGAEII